jgi:hypothetical protein
MIPSSLTIWMMIRTAGMKTKDAIGCSDAPTKKAVYLNEPMLLVDPSRFADHRYRCHHSHGETSMAHSLYHNGWNQAVDQSRLADRLYRQPTASFAWGEYYQGVSHYLRRYEVVC